MRKVVVIGATSGIGKGLAKKFAEKGCLVGVTGRRRELLEELKKERPESYMISAFDITDTISAIEALNDLTSKLGGLDLLIICAGTGDMNTRLDFEIEKRIIETNVIGFTNIVDWGFNYFENQKSGQLVAISSIGGLRGSRHAPSYNASKSYQMNYLEGLRQKSKFIKSSISITDIRPGLVDTDMAKGDSLFWVEPVQKVTNQIFKAIEKRKNVVYITKRWGIIARILKLMPRFLYDRM
ncbi:MAG: SDR family NAD(P)-dependent oxidoreductase [Bacteroidales bacterium]|nr:SDR family NAD(P)-dependent oxidoreductase [Bacteroidales bacterium]